MGRFMRSNMRLQTIALVDRHSAVFDVATRRAAVGRAAKLRADVRGIPFWGILVKIFAH
jgi:hypothetical protein